MEDGQKVYEFKSPYKRMGTSALVLLGLSWISPIIFCLAAAHLFVLPIVLLCPHKVILMGDKKLQLHYLFKIHTVELSDITKINDHVFHYTIHHAHGRIRISTLMHDSYGLMRTILNINPTISILK
jgi:hypothetical protein